MINNYIKFLSGHNSLKDFCWDNLKENNLVSNIVLDYNNIENIPSEVFLDSPLQYLVNLSIAHNNIKYMGSGFFEGE